MSGKITAPKLLAMRQAEQKIVCLTAYDSSFGEFADAAGADVILVGDSVANTLLGFDSTIPVTLEHMLHHTRAVRAGVKRALLVADLPFGSYQASVEQAITNAALLMKAGAEAVKLEGSYPETVTAMTQAGIPTMGHLGLTPQSIHRFGGHKVQGRGASGEAIVDAAVGLDQAGAIGIVLEVIPSDLAQRVTGAVTAPTIGIGAGPHCSGQIQVLHDVLGLTEVELKHAKRFLDGKTLVVAAMSEFARQVRSGEFPTEQHSF
jgi:3-methyl-2-oxobutanoate hydroxymethyltransferase